MPPASDLGPDSLLDDPSARARGGLDPYPLQETSLIAGSGGTGFFLNADARAGTAPNGKPSDTIDQAASQIVRGEPGWSAALGQGFTVTYAFRADAPAQMPSDTAGFTPFTQAQIDQTQLALQAWSDVANIRFVRVGSGDTGAQAYSDNATILFGNYSSGEAGSAAFGNFPGSTSIASSAGDVWVNSTFSYNQAPTVGNYGGQVLLHEIGHAIGLDHPSDYNAEANVTLSYATDASYYEDDRQYSVMSYFSEVNTGANFGGLYAAAPLLDDIAAAQLEYGANMATRTGNTIYGFNSNTGEPWYTITGSFQKTVFAIWDAGGNDTLDVSGYGQNQVIDLRAGFFSSVGGLTGNVAIAQGATIENAVGGSGADTITGNDAANSIQGGAGDDSIAAGAGADTVSATGARTYLRGEDGDDSIQGGSGFDDINGNKGQDTLDGGAGGHDWLVGGQGDDSINGAGTLDGNLGNDTITGAGQLLGEAGDDRLTSTGATNNTVVGGDGNDTLAANGTGADTLAGGNGDDSIVAGAGADSITGDAGNDTISVSGHAERIAGGAGADVFIFNTGTTAVGTVPAITDWSASQDKIRFAGYTPNPSPSSECRSAPMW